MFITKRFYSHYISIVFGRVGKFVSKTVVLVIVQFCKPILNMSFVLSKRGDKMLVHENHIYHFSKKTANGEHTIWICEKRTSCKGRVWTIGDSSDIFEIIAGHGHPAQVAKPEVIQTVNKTKNKAKETENPQQILASSLEGVHKNVLSLLPRKESIKRCIRKIKNLNDIPILPTTIEELVIPEEFAQITIDGRTETFLVHDSLLPQRMLIFSTKDNLSMLAKSDEWFADGTFDTCPPQFHQIYTVHVNNKHEIFPVVYALLPSKMSSIYSNLLKALKNLLPGMNPRNLMTDFELGAINAFHRYQHYWMFLSSCTTYLEKSTRIKTTYNQLLQYIKELVS